MKGRIKSIILIMISGAISVSADPIQVNESNSNLQLFPKVAKASGGQFVVAWCDNRDASNHEFEIYSHATNSGVTSRITGSDEELSVPIYGRAGHRLHAEMVPSNNGAMVAWIDHKENEVLTIRVDQDGDIDLDFNGEGGDGTPRYVHPANPNYVYTPPEMCSDGAGGAKVVETPDVIENPQMVYIEDGSVVISWEADRLIYCQKLDTTGVIHWDAEAVRVCLSDSAQRDHHMVTDGQDVWFVWQDERNDDGDIYAQKIDGSTGQRLWGDAGKAVCVKSGSQYDAHCALTETGGLGVAWHDVAVDPSQRIGSQYLLSDGFPVWGSSGLPTSINSNGGVTPLVVGSGEEFIVGYIGGTSPETGGIILQKFNPAGDYLFDTTGTAGVYSHYLWGMVDDAHNGCIVLFFKQRPPGISVQRFDSLGNAMWGANGIPLQDVSSSQMSRFLPSKYEDFGFLTDSSGGCFATWEWQIVAQHVDSTGGRWNSNGVSIWETPTGLERFSDYNSVTYDNAGGIFVVWDNWGIDTTDTYSMGVFIQRINKDGNTVFDENGLPVQLETAYSPVVQGVPGGCIVTWEDSLSLKLYSQFVDTTGKVGPGIDEDPNVVSPLDFQYRLDALKGTVLFSWPEGLGHATLSVFDVSGRLVNQYRSGSNSYVWNCRSQNGNPVSEGVYFVNLKTSNAQATTKLVLFK